MDSKSLLCSILLLAAFSSAEAAPAPALFADPIVAKGKGGEVRQSQIDEAFTSFKASRAAAGQSVPRSLDKDLQTQIVDKLIATQLFLARATTEDKATGKELGEKFLKETKAKTSSDAAFKRQLLALG